MRLSILLVLQFFFTSIVFTQPDIYCTTPGDPNDPNWVDWLQNENEVGPFFVKLKFQTNESQLTEDDIQLAVDNLAQYFNPENIFFGWDCTIHSSIPPTQGGNPPEPDVMNVEVLGGTSPSGYASGGGFLVSGDDCILDLAPKTFLGGVF